MRSIISIASTTVGEAVRRKALLVILLIGLLFMVIAPAMGALSARSETTVLKSMMLGIIQLTSAVIAIVLTVYMIPNEIERRTIYTILSKPVQRWQFLIGKYVGAVLALGFMMGLMTIVLLVEFTVQQGAHDVMDIAKGPALYFIQMSLLAAVAIFFSTFVSPLVNFFLSGGVYLLGSLFAPFLKSMEENSHMSVFSADAAKVINTVIPNFAMFNTQNPIINPTQTITSESGYYVNATIYGAIYVGILIVAGIMIFDRREV